ncbi:MAG: hypothetical protein ACOY5B_07000 [Spirochaetota bacterium]
MALVAGKDYALAKKVTWVFQELGPADAVAVATEKALYVIPTRGIEESFNIGGVHPLQAIESMLGNPASDHATMNQLLEKWATELKGIVKPMSDVKRIKIKTSFFTRMVGYSEKDTGFDSGFGTAVVLRPRKDEMAGFISLHQNDRRVMV